MLLKLIDGEVSSIEKMANNLWSLVYEKCF